MDNCLGCRRRILVLLRKIGDAIVRRAGGVDQRCKLAEGFDRDEDRPDGQRGTGHAIRHPDRNRGRVLVVLAQPELATMAHAALNQNRLAVQRMPRIVDGEFLSVVGRM
jgi:hypothetical protein